MVLKFCSSRRIRQFIIFEAYFRRCFLLNFFRPPQLLIIPVDNFNSDRAQSLTGKRHLFMSVPNNRGKFDTLVNLI